jgi:hypothetical protein
VRISRIAILLLLASSVATAQIPSIAAVEPTATFTLDFPGSVPSHYSLRVTRAGAASYESIGKLSPETEGDPFSYQFAMSTRNVTRIFDLAAAAEYFAKGVQVPKGKQANMGKKTLAYEDAQQRHDAVFNYSSHPEIQELTRLFQAIAATMEFARQLQYFHRYQPLALEDNLKRLEEMAKTDDLEEIAALAPILQQIVDDKAILNVSRARAMRLLSRPQVLQTQ